MKNLLQLDRREITGNKNRKKREVAILLEEPFLFSSCADSVKRFSFDVLKREPNRWIGGERKKNCFQWWSVKFSKFLFFLFNKLKAPLFFLINDKLTRQFSESIFSRNDYRHLVEYKRELKFSQTIKFKHWELENIYLFYVV